MRLTAPRAIAVAVRRSRSPMPAVLPMKSPRRQGSGDVDAAYRCDQCIEHWQRLRNTARGGAGPGGDADPRLGLVLLSTGGAGGPGHARYRLGPAPGGGGRVAGVGFRPRFLALCSAAVSSP